MSSAGATRSPLRRTTSLLVCLAMLLLAPVVIAADDEEQEDKNGPTPADEALKREVVDAYAAQLKAAQSIEFRYTVTYSGGRRECRYARDGERFRHGHILIGRDGEVSMPHDVAYDGKTSYYRMSEDRVATSGSADHFRKGAPLPDEDLNTYPAQAYGWESTRGVDYEFRSAREVEFDGLDCVEMKFDVLGRRRNEVLIIRHAKEHGYWPVHVWRARPGVMPSYEMVALRFAKSVADGKAVYYPLYFESCEFNRRGNRRSVFAVDEATLKVNQPIDPSRFMIATFPWDRVSDYETGKRKEAEDPVAKPDARMGFPFEVMLEALARAQPS